MALDSASVPLHQRPRNTISRTAVSKSPGKSQGKGLGLPVARASSWGPQGPQDQGVPSGLPKHKQRQHLSNYKAAFAGQKGSFPIGTMVGLLDDRLF